MPSQGPAERGGPEVEAQVGLRETRGGESAQASATGTCWPLMCREGGHTEPHSETLVLTSGAHCCSSCEGVSGASAQRSPKLPCSLSVMC